MRAMRRDPWLGEVRPLAVLNDWCWSVVERWGHDKPIYKESPTITVERGKGGTGR